MINEDLLNLTLSRNGNLFILCTLFGLHLPVYSFDPCLFNADFRLHMLLS